MSKNIIIFSDGTGQAGGLIPDEVETNVYKLYRATRCGPLSDIDPLEQVSFYDPGLGSPADGGGLKLTTWRWLYNLVSQGTGLGLTRNIIDCYTAIIQLYEPEDRIYLVGFSRGAYTARCIGGVLGLCGVPTLGGDGKLIRRDPKSARAVSEDAVTSVYLYGNGWSAPRFSDQRKQIAAEFRVAHGSDDNGQSNVVPYFIGVWDTVSAVGASWNVILIAVAAATAIFVVLGALLHFALRIAWPILFFNCAMVVLGLMAIFLITHFRASLQTSYRWWQTVHFNISKVTFHDTKLNPRVQYAKHAQSIDENRKDFERVPWSLDGIRDVTTGWFEQIWFAGIHADVGGGYFENESRLSDISLGWMVEKATTTPFPIKVDRSYLSLYPSANGPQHDERKSGLIPWAFGLRSIPPDAPLHPTVLERFKLPSVLVFDQMKPYRPEPLRNHRDVSKYYSQTK